MNNDVPLNQQYCLKWNNHKNNISGVFDRLRINEKFVDVTLSSADRKNLKCHRMILSAGSGYLEEILSQNPSDHPTVVLSQIYYNELKLLIDFMYSGEVAVEQSGLNALLEAAKILKIKGLWESGLDSAKDEDEAEEGEIHSGIANSSDGKNDNQVSPSMPELKSPPSIDNIRTMMQVVGNKRRKRSRNENSVEEMTETNQNKVSRKEGQEFCKVQGKVYTPQFGISNAFFLTQPPPLKTIIENTASIPKILTDDLKSNASSSPSSPSLQENVPSLLSQSPSLQNAINANTSLPFLPLFLDPHGNNLDGEDKNSVKSQQLTASFFGSTPVRRYKQYTEDTLQMALKEIMEGQSINRSSMKYNIPARTLRDWMKRLNIKSVFTHHGNQDERGSSIDSNPDESNESKSMSEKLNGSSFTLMGSNPNFSGCKSGPDNSEDDEEEIDDDEEKILQIVHE